MLEVSYKELSEICLGEQSLICVVMEFPTRSTYCDFLKKFAIYKESKS